ncbi:unnamed protein product [Victoria cruziana]
MDASTFDDLQLVKKCCFLAFKAQHSSADFSKDNSHRSHAIFAFSSADNWFSGDQLLGTTKSPSCFPSLKVLGSGDSGILNRAFLQRFHRILGDSSSQASQLRQEADRTRKRKIVFTGHSGGGAIAILTTIWFLENRYRRDPGSEVLCITFGSPLVGDKIVGHAIRREGWSSFFKNFVLPWDPVPRVHFSPRDKIAGDVLSILQSRITDQRESVSRTSSSSDPAASNQLSEDLFNVVLEGTFAIASYDSCVLRCSVGGSSLLEAVNKIVEPNPYRPFGSFYFCCSDGNVVKVENHDAVLQMLFYSLRLRDPSGGNNGYRTYEIKKIVPLGDLKTIPLSADDVDDVHSALNILDLDIEARLSLIAAGETKRVREKNLATVTGYIEDINACLTKLQTYRASCDDGVGYYDAFKLQQNRADFEANVTRLELVGYWEEVRNLLKLFELPDSFEADRDWVELGTRIRLLVEPIDIANFYRHGKNEQTNLYTTDSRARPNYYRYPENWLHHMRRFAPENDPIRTNKEWNLDSCLWARVENMCIGIKKKGFDSEKENVSKFEEEVERWLTEEALNKLELKRPTFQRWWTVLPEERRNRSCIRNFMEQKSAADPRF